MQLVILLISVISVTLCARVECTNKHTSYYMSRCCPVSNYDAFFYRETRATSDLDRCEVYTNQRLRGMFSWITPTDHVEHIIDSNNGPSKLINCNKNIRGNLIIAKGQWNTQLGNMCWADVEQEKREVYGNDIFQYAYDSVELCCQLQEEKSNIPMIILGVVVCLGITIGILTAGRVAKEVPRPEWLNNLFTSHPYMGVWDGESGNDIEMNDRGRL